MIEPALLQQAQAVLAACRARGWTLATAESCTGGLVAGTLTAIPGSSDVMDRGFVTYSNAAKMAMLGVPAETLDQFGAVSAQTAEAMARGALAAAGTALAVSITGVAGPGGGTDAKPVGLVHFGCARADGTLLLREERFGALSRDDIRARSVAVALDLLAELAG